MINTNTAFLDNTKVLAMISIVKRYMAIFIIISLSLVMSLVSEQFRTMNNFMNIIKQASILGCIAVGVGVLLIQRSFDLSIGSILSLTHVLVIWLLAAGFHPFFAVVLTLLGGAACGMVNGYFVGYLQGNSMMVTFGAQVIFQGIALLLTKGKYISLPRGTGFEYIAKGYLGPIPFPAIIMIVLMIIGNFVLLKTTAGRVLYAMGANERATTLNGVRVKLVRMGAYVLAGVTTAISGIIVSGRVLSANHFIGKGYEFDAQIACVLGGVYLFGGKGTVGGAIFGAFVLALIQNSMTILGVRPYFQLIVRGMILIFMVGMDTLTNKERKS